MSELFEALINENKKLITCNKVLRQKLSIAVEGLKVLFSDGDINGIPRKTLEAIEDCNEELPQDNNIKQKKIDK